MSRVQIAVSFAAATALLAGVAGLWWLLPAPAEPPSGCATCHSAEEGPADVMHAGLPCVTCHAGDPQALRADEAHADLERDPGALDRADTTCGVCHPTQLATVRQSKMATAQGITQGGRLFIAQLITG